MKTRCNWFNATIAFYVLFFLFALWPKPVSCQDLEIGSPAVVYIPIHFDYTDLTDVTAAHIRIGWDSTHFDLVDHMPGAQWDSLGYFTVVNDTLIGRFEFAAAGTEALYGDSLLFELVFEVPAELSVQGGIEVTAMFNEEVERVKTIPYIIDPLLPVELIEFDAIINDERAHLRWATASEQNAAGFEVYAINHNWQDDGRWVPSTTYYLGFVAANGTTGLRSDYEMRAHIQPGLYRFRLRQLDFDGQFEDFYSTIYGVGMERALLELHPNPANPTVNISITIPTPQYVTVRLYNILGQDIATIRQDVMAGHHVIRQDLSSLPSGVYFVAVETATGLMTKKLTVIK